MHDKKKGGSGSSEPYKIQIECIFDDLSDAQVKAQEKRLQEYNEFKKKFDQYTANRTELNIERGDLCTFVEFLSSGPSALQTQTAIPVVPVNPPPLQKQNGRVTTTNTSQNNHILLVNNQRIGLTGLIVPTSVPMSSSSNVMSSVNVVNIAGSNVPVSPSQNTLISNKGSTVVSRISSPQLVQPQGSSAMLTKTVESVGGKILVQSRTVVPVNVPCKRPLEVTTAPTKTQSITVASPSILGDTSDVTGPPPPKKKSGYPLPSPIISIDLTEDLSKIEGASGASGKTYPSLVVTARPCMRSDKEAKSPVIVREKQALDTQVRRVLLLSPQNFTEWLIKTGLLRCDHHCCIHTADDGSKIKLKLGQYTDSNKFPFSGGYVWVSDCCPQTYVTVFSGSIFEGANYPPTTTMKLIYHWACHTSIQNILQWVNVSNLYIKNLFTTLRAVCTAAIHEHYELMGGKDKKIQVGVVSLGTSSKENISKKVRVDILCLLDPETKIMRIRAVEPTLDPERFVLRKFSRIFEIMPHWVDRETTILVDNTVERSVLYNIGFKSVSQTLVKDKKGVDQFPNYEVMDYLRIIVPKMFQNTLSILSRQVIQQFLDELCWRERWGPFPARAFDTIIKHLIEQTKINSGAPLLNRLSKISANPFKDWKYYKWRPNCLSRPSGSSTKPMLPNPTTPLGGCGGPPQKVAVTSDTQLITTPVAIPPPPETSHSIQSSSHNIPTTSHSLQSPSLSPQAESSIPSQVVIMPKNTQVPVMVEAAKILLEPYFYGTLKGDINLQNMSVDFNLNCVICRKLFTNNIDLTDHLIKHAIIFNENKELCKICCKTYPTIIALQQHQKVHEAYYCDNSLVVPKSSQWCLICSMRFLSLNSLIWHMSRYHGEMELPYACNICGFRTSIFIKMIDHINTLHNRDDSAFCPYCFESFRYYHNGKPNIKSQYRFTYHVQRHLLPLVRKCYKCVTTCLNKSTLYEHEVEAHRSFSNNEEIERFTTSKDTYMPAPLEDPIPPKLSKFKLAVGGPYKAVTFSAPFTISEEDSKTVCIECDAKIDNNHYMSELLCMTCDFSTCCIRAMNEHIHDTHFYSTNLPRFYKNIPVISDTNLNCSCSFTTKDGNIMANHLITCKKTMCYCDPKDGGSTNIKSVIGIQDVEAEETPEIDLTFVVEPSTSNNETFTARK